MQAGSPPRRLRLTASAGRGADCAVAVHYERAAAKAGSAFVEPARQALLATFLIDEGRLAALLAEIADAPPLFELGSARRRVLGFHLADVLGQRASQRVGQREDLARAKTHRLGAADAGELADHLFEPSLR